MNVIIDCNVIISAALSSKTCSEALARAFEKSQVCASVDIMDEYKEVQSRSKFFRLRHVFADIMASFLYINIWENVARSEMSSPDPKDQMYLDLAATIPADYLITGNLRDFPDRIYGQTRVVSPREFLTLVS